MNFVNLNVQKPQENTLAGALQQLLPEEFISQCLQEAGVATVRRRRLPLESLVMAVLGMAL